MSVTDYKRVCEAIKVKLGKVSGVGRVEVINRDIKDKRDLIASGLLRRQDIEIGEVGAERLNYWVVSRRDSRDVKEAQECDTIRDAFIIRGYRGVYDLKNTETEFQQTINNIREDFRLHDTLHDTCETAGPAEVETIDWALLGGIFCHYCEIRYDVQFYFTGATS